MKDFDIIEVIGGIGMSVIKVLADSKLLALAGWTTIMLEGLKTYFFADFKYLGFLGAVVIANIVSKIYQIINDNAEFSFKLLFLKLANKIIKYGCILVMSHALSSYTISGEVNSLFGFVPTFFTAIPMVLELESVVDNLGFKLNGRMDEIIKSVKNIIKPKDENHDDFHKN